MKTENAILIDNIDKMFEMAMDASYPLDERSFYDAQGHKLRARLVALLSAEFTDGTTEVINANKKIKEVNAILKKRRENLESAAKTMGAVGELVSIIDDLFKLPFIFV